MSVKNTLWDAGEDPKNIMGPQLIPIMEETELHYIGGFVDGDGSVHISVEKAPTSKLGYRIRPRFSLTQKRSPKSDEALKLLKDFCEELNANYSVNDNNGEWKFEVVGTRNVLTFLEGIAPYLRGKEEEAELVLDADWPTRGGSFDPVEERQEQFMQLMRVRQQVRSLGANRETKYTMEFFEEEFSQ